MTSHKLITTKTKIPKVTALNKTTVVNVKKAELIKNGYAGFEDWASSANHVYIGRDMNFYVKGTIGSIWQNPFVVAKPGKEYKCRKPRYTLDDVLRLYKEHIEASPDLINKLHELKGKTLGCWCKPNKCHGDVLIELINKHC